MSGFTLIEMLMGLSIMTVVFVALIGAFLGQSFLNANARYLTAAMNDATRVMEQIRQQNTGSQGTCAQNPPFPSAQPPGTFPDWNTWLISPSGGGGTSVTRSDMTQSNGMIELIAVTCQDSVTQAYCGLSSTPGLNQVGSLEWKVGNPDTKFNPIRVTVAIGWRQDRRVLGSSTTGGQEFTFVPSGTGMFTSGKQTVTSSGTLQAGPDANGNDVIDSQAMLTTLVTCR